jgi:hypothetical protein
MLYLYYLRNDKNPSNAMNPMLHDFKTTTTFCRLRLRPCACAAASSHIAVNIVVESTIVAAISPYGFGVGRQ